MKVTKNDEKKKPCRRFENNDRNFYLLRLIIENIDESFRY